MYVMFVLLGASVGYLTDGGESVSGNLLSLEMLIFILRCLVQP